MTEPEDPTVPPGDAADEADAEVIEEIAVVEPVDAFEEVAAVEEEVEADEEVDPPVAGVAGAAVENPSPSAVPVAEAVTGAPKPQQARGARPDLIDRREPLY